jgi:Rieske Fe-S protein
MEPISRRALITGACALVLLGGSNLPSVASTAVKKLPDGRLSVRVRSVPDLADVGGAVRVGTFKGNPIGLARTGTSTYVAFSLKCPHQQVTVIRDASGWVCPAHNSQFEPDGDLILGPATKRLSRVPVKVTRGQVIIG